MDNINELFSKNIIRLRTENGLTQLELAEKLNYSDKAISRWERAEAIPDAKTLVVISEMFNISLNDLLCNENPQKVHKRIDVHNHKNISVITFIGVWTVALFTFIISWLCSNPLWLAFVYALPLSLLVELIFSSIWGERKNRLIITSLLCWSLLASVFISGLFWSFNWWQIFLLGIPTQLLILFGFRFKKK